jgi:thiopurine S-methyltransferase
MQPEFWHERWQRNEIGFHQDRPHAALARHWPALQLAPGSRVFVPLAGKSLDMVWLAANGYRVVGVELSPIAVRDFFAAQQVTPVVERHGALERHAVDSLELWCGDVFDLTPALLGDIDAIFDRAALVALPPALRQRYAAQLVALSGRSTQMLLVTMEYDQAQMPGPPHAVPEAEVQALYGATHAIELLERNTALADFPKFAQRGVSALAEAVYHLRPRAG